MAEQEVPLLWLNPIDETIGTVCTARDVDTCTDVLCAYTHDRRAFAVAPHEVGNAEDYLIFSVDRLAACRLSPAGLKTPTLDHLARSRVALLVARATDSAKEREYAAEKRRKRMKAQRAQQESHRRRQAALAEYYARYPQPEHGPRVPPGMLVCSVCKGSMDPSLARAGKHVLC